MNKILVTGATGFIGGNLVSILAQEGYKVRCLVRKNSRLDFVTPFSPEFFFGDITDVRTLPKSVEGIDAVIHCAGATRAKVAAEYYRINEDGSRNLYETCHKTNPGLGRIVHIGSLAGIGPSQDGEPVTEETLPNPISDYGKSKLAGQKIAESFMNRLPICSLMPPAVYGPMDRDFLAYFRMIKRGIMPMLGKKTRWFSLIHVKDVARAVLACLKDKRSIGRSYLLSDNETQSWESMTGTLSHVMGKKPLVIHLPERIAQGFAFGSEEFSRFIGQAPLLTRQKMNEFLQDAWVCSSNRIREELGFSSVYSLERGLQETLDWYVANQWL